MNIVTLSGYIKYKNDLKTSSKGTQYLKNVLTVTNDKNDSQELIPFIAFKNNAVLIDKAGAGVTIEIKGTLHNKYDKEKKTNDMVVYVDEVTLTGAIQDEEAFIDNNNSDTSIDDGTDDLPF